MGNRKRSIVSTPNPLLNKRVPFSPVTVTLIVEIVVFSYTSVVQLARFRSAVVETSLPPTGPGRYGRGLQKRSSRRRRSVTGTIRGGGRLYTFSLIRKSIAGYPVVRRKPMCFRSCVFRGSAIVGYDDGCRESVGYSTKRFDGRSDRRGS